jgi:hypothetical protein
MPITEFKIIDLKKFQIIFTLLGLFIPVPIEKHTPDYVIGGYGFAYTIALGRHVPLGWVMIIIALIF